MDRIAELVTRHHLGQYSARVSQRLDELCSAPSDQLEATEAALLKACDALGVTGLELDEVGRQAGEVGAPS